MNDADDSESLNFDDDQDGNGTGLTPLSRTPAVVNLIAYAKLTFQEQNDGQCFVTSDLEPRQRDFLAGLLQGGSVLEVKTALGVSGIELVLWRSSDLFMACLDIIKEAEAIDAEAMTWHNATKNDKAMIERMFAIKSRRPEYKDNAPPAKTGNINIQVNLGDKQFDISANLADQD